MQCPKHCPGVRGVLLASNIQLVKGSLTVVNINRSTRTIRQGTRTARRIHFT